MTLCLILLMQRGMYIIIIIKSRCWARISLSLCLAICPYHLSLPVGLLDYILCPYKAVVGKFLLVVQHCHVYVQGPWENVTYDFVLASSAVFRMSYLDGFSDRRHNCCLMGCCFQDLFNIARSILVQFSSSVFSKGFLSVHMAHSCSRIDTTAAWKKLHFILSDRPEFHIIAVSASPGLH